MLSFPSKSPLLPQLRIDPLWATFSLRLWSRDQLETIPARSDAFPGELVQRFKAEHGMFPCSYFMFYYRAIKIGFGISSTRWGQTGAKPVKIPSWYEAKFPALLSELLFTRPSLIYTVCAGTSEGAPAWGRVLTHSSILANRNWKSQVRQEWARKACVGAVLSYAAAYPPRSSFPAPLSAGIIYFLLSIRIYRQ